jgi:hypothetical protein
MLLLDVEHSLFRTQITDKHSSGDLWALERMWPCFRIVKAVVAQFPCGRQQFLGVVVQKARALPCPPWNGTVGTMEIGPYSSFGARSCEIVFRRQCSF